MSVIFPFISWCIISAHFCRRGIGLRISSLASSLILGIVVTVSTELLSLKYKLDYPHTLITWGIVLFAALITYHSGRKSERRTLLATGENILSLKLFQASILVILIVTGIIALVAPPNNFDSMTYHMSRVAHWIQNQSVGHYPTHIARQLYLPPWAEFAITHLQILTGGDYLANLVQWFSMLGCILGITLIAKELGANLSGQTFAAVFCATIPMGVLQSTSTQNDYVVSFWLVCFVYFGMRWKEDTDWRFTLAAGTSLGLAILTKGTAYIFALPFLVWFSMSGIRNLRWGVIKHFLVLCSMVLIMNAGHYIRNYEIFGNPLGTDDLPPLSNEVINLPVAISNITRNLALHAGTPFDEFNRVIRSGIESLHSSLGIDINDRKTTFGKSLFALQQTSLHEDMAGNPLHLILAMISGILVLNSRIRKRHSSLLPYILVVFSACLLFCIYLKWQPWHSRLQLPLFVLSSPFVGIILTESRRKFVANSIMVILLGASLPWLLGNASRPILGNNSIITTSRIDQYFINQPLIEESFFDAADLIDKHKCKSIGIVLGRNDWEYPLWVLLRRNGNRTPRIEHVNVLNRSGKIKQAEFKPCAIVSSDKDRRLSVTFK